MDMKFGIDKPIGEAASKITIEAQRTAGRVFHEFPKMIYHPENGHMSVRNRIELETYMCKGWFESPVDADLAKIPILEKEILELDRQVEAKEKEIRRIKEMYSGAVAASKKMEEINKAPNPSNATKAPGPEPTPAPTPPPTPAPAPTPTPDPAPSSKKGGKKKATPDPEPEPVKDPEPPKTEGDDEW